MGFFQNNACRASTCALMGINMRYFIVIVVDGKDNYLGGIMMKEKEIRLSSEQRENFERFMDLSDRYKNSWFWSDNGNCSCRAYKERRDKIDYETVVNGDTYSVYFSVSMSRRNVYVTKVVTKNGIKTNARVIRTLLSKDKSVVCP